MTERSVQHATFVVERTYDAAPARVFAAFADPAARARWFVGPDAWEASDHELDFRVGGRERVRGGPVHAYDARYRDIVPNRRIISGYAMHLNETRSSVSLATVELELAGAGTRLIYTEQGAFLDGHDTPAQREQGTRALLDNLDAALRREPVSTCASAVSISRRLVRRTCSADHTLRKPEEHEDVP